MNLILSIDFWIADDEFSWNFILFLQNNFDMTKKTLEVFWRLYLNIVFLNIIVNVNFFSDLKFEYYCEYYPEILLQVSLE